MSIADLRPAVTIDALTEAWRQSHRAAVSHLIASSYAECGCSAVALCDVGKLLDERALFAEQRMNLPPRLAAFTLSDERAEGRAS